MNLPKINLKELQERKEQNFKERLEFTKTYAKKLREQKTQEQDLHN